MKILKYLKQMEKALYVLNGGLKSNLDRDI